MLDACMHVVATLCFGVENAEVGLRYLGGFSCAYGVLSRPQNNGWLTRVCCTNVSAGNESHTSTRSLPPPRLSRCVIAEDHQDGHVRQRQLE